MEKALRRHVLVESLFLLLALTSISILNIPEVSATLTEDTRQVTMVDVFSELMPENFTNNDYLNTTNPYSDIATIQGALDEVDDAEGDKPLYVLVFGDEEES